MNVGVLQFELLIHDAESLKDKRRVVKSVKDRLHREHLVSVAEVGSLENHTRALIGVALVGTDGKRMSQVFDTIVNKMRSLHDAELGMTIREFFENDDEAPADDEDENEDWREDINVAMLDRAEEIDEEPHAEEHTG